MRSFLHDLSYTTRTLRSARGFTTIAIVTLGLGMMVNTTVFSVINGLLRPLPVSHPEQIAVLTMTQDGTPGFQKFSYPDYEDIRNQADAFSDVFAYRPSLQGISADGKVDVCIVSRVTGNYFSALGIEPKLGRLILPGEGQKPNADPVIVLGYSYWQKRFGGSPDVIGKQIELNDRPLTIVGVVPQRFKGALGFVEMDAYAPLSVPIGSKGSAQESVERMWVNREDRQLSVLGRLRPGVTVEQSQSILNIVAQRMAQDHPNIDKGMRIQAFPEKAARPEPDPDNTLPTVSVAFTVLAAMVLLVACFNIANMFLVRAAAREREMGIRAALGAGRGRLIRQHLMESCILSILGGATGLLLSTWAAGFLSSVPLGTDFFITLDFEPDTRVYAFALFAVIVTGVLVGILPALRAARSDVNVVLREGGRSASDGPRRRFVRNTLVAAQLAGCLLLLVVAGLFLRSLNKVHQMNLGFNPDHVLNVTVSPTRTQFDETRGAEFYRQVEERLSALPGVISVSQAFSAPLGALSAEDRITVEGLAVEPGQEPPEVMRNTVTPSYFQTLRIPIETGRGFTKADDEKAPGVSVINRAMAEKFWPDQDPIGKRFSISGAKGPFIQVIGIVPTGKYDDLTEAPRPFFYIPMAQHYSGYRNIHIRTSAPPETLSREIDAQIQALGRGAVDSKTQTMLQALQGINGFFFYRFGAQLTTTMALLGLVVAVVGIYSVSSYAAAQRTHEIGIRMALGAHPQHIMRMVLRQSIVTIGSGIAIGLGAALAGTRMLADLIVGIRPDDPLTFISVVLLLCLVSLVACWIPARRATRVDPLTALRYE